jgi:hypothetical protein
MNKSAKTLLAFWEDPRNIPFKNSLISSEPPKDGDKPTTCMCAQGQALYMIGGYSEEQLRNTETKDADKEVARLLGISVAHSILLRTINDGQPGAPSDVLTNPEKYLGKNYQAVLDFWTVMDSLTKDQWNEVSSRYVALDYAALDAAWDAAWDAASYAAGDAAWDAAYCAAWYAARYAAWNAASLAAGYAAWYATYELMEGIENPVFVPLFDNLVG